MKRVCAWCQEALPAREAETPSVAAGDDEVTHGLCPACVDNIQFQQGVELERYLDALPTPVLLVTSGGVVEMANQRALGMFAKHRHEFVGVHQVDVFECPYARRPGGCGREVCCSGCVIRHAVAETFATGQSRRHVPATLTRPRGAGTQQVRLLISTRKVRQTVLLHIDEVHDPEDPPAHGRG